jgi:hypothetical protein
MAAKFRPIESLSVQSSCRLSLKARPLGEKSDVRGSPRAIRVSPLGIDWNLRLRLVWPRLRAHGSLFFETVDSHERVRLSEMRRSAVRSRRRLFEEWVRWYPCFLNNARAALIPPQGREEDRARRLFESNPPTAAPRSAKPRQPQHQVVSGPAFDRPASRASFLNSPNAAATSARSRSSNMGWQVERGWSR